MNWQDVVIMIGAAVVAAVVAYVVFFRKKDSP